MRNPNITVTVCDRSGKIGADAATYHGTACVLDSALSAQVARAIQSKYFVLGRLLQIYGAVTEVMRPSKRVSETAIKFVLQN